MCRVGDFGFGSSDVGRLDLHLNEQDGFLLDISGHFLKRKQLLRESLVDLFLMQDKVDCPELPFVEEHSKFLLSGRVVESEDVE